MTDFEQASELDEFGETRIGRIEMESDRRGTSEKSVCHEGCRKLLYAQDWFDSSSERDVANTLEDEEEITSWVRLQIDDLPILWTDGCEYNPDFIAIDRDNTHWLIGVKMDKEMTSADVQGKRVSARRWANRVSADEQVGATWRYLLASESDVKTAKGSWTVLKALGA